MTSDVDRVLEAYRAVQRELPGDMYRLADIANERTRAAAIVLFSTDHRQLQRLKNALSDLDAAIEQLE